MSNYEPNTKFFVQIKYLEQALTEAEYQAHLDTASYVYAFGGTAQVQKFIEQTRERPDWAKPSAFL